MSGVDSIYGWVMRKLLKFVAILVVGLIVAVVAALIFVPKSVILNQVLAQVERQTGYAITVGEDVSLSFYPQLSLTANDLRVVNGAAGVDAPMVTADHVRFGLDTMPLLRGEVIAETIELIRPVVAIDTGLFASGASTGTQDAAASNSAGGLALPHFKNIHIEDGRIRYVDQGAETVVEGLGLDLRWPAYAGAVDATVAARLNGAAVAVDAKLNSLVQLIEDRRVEAQLRNARYDGYTLSGPVAVDLSGDVPRVTGQIALGPIVIAGGSESSSSASGSGWSTDAIDASALGAVNADVAISGSSIKAAGLSIGAYKGRVALDAARLVATIDALSAYQGNVAGQVVLNARSGLSASAKVTVNGVEAQPLLTDVAGIKTFDAPLSAQMDVLVSGRSVDAMMKSLSGTVQFTSEGGRIEGLDLDKVLRSGDVSGGTTVFDAFSGSFVAQNGVLRGDDLALVLPNFRTDGAGTIDVGHQMIDYLISPTATAARDGKGLSIPVRIKGPWSGPKILPDLEALARQNAGEEIEKARKAAEEKAKALIEEKTGIAIQDGQSVEEAVKQKVETEVKKTETEVKKKIEDEVKKKLENELKKGIGGLFGN